MDNNKTFANKQLAKCPTGIEGLDTITNGGLPRNRLTLICGGAGSGKTSLGVEFLVQGIIKYNEPGLLITFEEKPQEIIENAASIGFDLEDLINKKKLFIEYIEVQEEEIAQSGDYTLEGLFIRFEQIVTSIAIKRVSLDTLDSIFATLGNTLILRAEIYRLFSWLKQKNITSLVTAEAGINTLSRNGLEEYISDCVISLRTNIVSEVLTRLLRIVKYRGSKHGTNEYPFLITDSGINLFPITSNYLNNIVSTEFVSTGVKELDEMMDNKGYYQGSTVLITGTAGTGKTSLASIFSNSICQKGERCIYFTFEEMINQILRNMSSINLNLQQWIDKDLLKFYAYRSSIYGLETHLLTIQNLIKQFKPQAVIIDPINNFELIGTELEIKSMMTRLIDFLKAQQITALFTSLTTAINPKEHAEVGISSLIDSWLVLQNLEYAGERTRGITIVKSRGIAHSNQIREFIITSNGVKLEKIYVGPNGILTGSARLDQEEQENLQFLLQEKETLRRKKLLEHKKATLEAKIMALKSEFDADTEEIESLIMKEEIQNKGILETRSTMAQRRINNKK